MKKIITILTIILVSFTQNFAQLYNKGAQIKVENGAVLKVEGDFLNDINSNFSNNGKVILKANITNNQTMAAQSAGIWELSGASQQAISGIYPLQVFDIKFDNGAGFVLNNGMKIYNQANFANGLVNNADASLMIFGSVATIPIAATDASHVTGPVVKEGTSAFTYPVGDATKYQPINAAFIENTGGFSAKYLPSDAGSGSFGTSGTETTALTAYNSNEFWDLKPINEGNTSAIITLFWDGYKDGSAIDYMSRRVAHKSGNVWLNEGSSANVSGNSMAGSVKSNLMSSWSPIALGFVTATPLPLSLLNFSGKNENGNIVLNWLTANEIGVSHFEIEKSPLTPGGGISSNKFENIGQVKSNESGIYEYLDSTPPLGAGGLYRLKMVDLDGKYSYSKIISIKNNFNQNSELKLYPNPAIAEIKIENANGNDIEINNISGQKQIFNTLIKEYSLSTIDVSKLQAGVYFLKAGNQVKKFLKK